MATLTELYVKVRNQTDTTSAELPNDLINQYLQEAFNRTIAGENLWPSYEQTWDLTLTAGESSMSLPGDVNVPGITALWDVTGERRLALIDQGKALDFYSGAFISSPSGPIVYTVWANQINLYPEASFADDKDYKMYGYRRAAAWSSLGVGDEPDCDSRLHLALAHYATALAYAREEDDVLENQYMQRWQRDVEQARSAIMEANRQRPLTMGPDFHSPIGPRGPRWGHGVVINTP